MKNQNQKNLNRINNLKVKEFQTYRGECKKYSKSEIVLDVIYEACYNTRRGLTMIDVVIDEGLEH